MKNIAIIAPRAWPDILIFRKELIKLLVSKEYQIFVFASDWDQKTISEIQSWGVIAVRYDLKKNSFNPLRELASIIKLSRLLKKYRVDIVFSCLLKPSLYGSIAGLFAGVNRRVAMLEGLGFIYTQNSKDFSYRKLFLQFVHGAIATVGFKFAHSVIVLNEQDRDDLRSRSYIPMNKFRVLGPIGVDLTEFPYSKPVEANVVRFLFIGRLLNEKGVNEFFAAAEELKSIGSSAEFTVIGGLYPDNPSSLSDLQLKSQLDRGVVKYEGVVSDIPDRLRKCDVFVLPSYREGFPRSTQEAMAIGRAVITTNAAGCRDTVQDGVNGFLVPVGDSRQLAIAMKKFIDNPGLIRSQGFQSRMIAERRFDSRVTSERLASLILEP